MRITHALAALTLGLALAVAGCGDDEDAGADRPEFNDADVTFAQEMILHHQQAIMMAVLAVDRSPDPAVSRLARQIQQAQEPEIETMQGWLADWGAEVSHDMEGDMGPMPGMMSERQMSTLATASRSAVDRIFLELMIEHHQGAIQMAQTEQQNGANPAAIDLAEQIEATQTREVAQMRAMLSK